MNLRLRIVTLAAFVFFSPREGSGQNLVPNPSFENKNGCVYLQPGNLARTQFPSLTDWSLATANSWVYYFNACKTDSFISELAVPSNLYSSYTPARTGDGYISIPVLWNYGYEGEILNPADSMASLPYQSYIQAPLTQTLQTGKKYCVSFWVSYASLIGGTTVKDNTVLTKSLGINFSAYRPFGLNDTILNVVPQILPDSFISTDTTWTKISGVYTAQGGEKWITLGNFEAATETDFVYYGPYDTAGYHIYSSIYFVDDVSVEPIESYSSRDTSVCEMSNFPIIIAGESGGSFYLWNTGETTQSINISDTGKYWYRTNTGCGEFTDTVWVHFIEKNELLPFSDTFFCSGKYLIITANGGFTNYTWQGISGNQTVTINEPGDYILTANSICGLQSDTLSVVERDLSEPPIVTDTIICIGTESPNLNVVGLNLMWYEDELGEGQDVQPDINTAIAHDLVLYVSQNTNGCESAKDPIEISIYPTPNNTLSERYIFCVDEVSEIGTEILLPQYNYLWNTGSTSPTIRPLTSGIYSLAVTDHCGTVERNAEVTISRCEDCIFVPDVFTPNNDGKNDYYGATLKCPYIKFSLRVFNRWGQVVFSSEQPEDKWNGYYKGIQADLGMYSYLLELKPTENRPLVRLEGNLLLVR